MFNNMRDLDQTDLEILRLLGQLPRTRWRGACQ